jgi:hypothetical protein
VQLEDKSYHNLGLTSGGISFAIGSEALTVKASLVDVSINNIKTLMKLKQLVESEENDKLVLKPLHGGLEHGFLITGPAPGCGCRTWEFLGEVSLPLTYGCYKDKATLIDLSVTTKSILITDGCDYQKSKIGY